MFREHSLTKLFLSSFNYLASPVNLSYWWNWGSIIGALLVCQILTGVFLTMHYSGDISNSFSSVMHIQRDVNSGWIIRGLHVNSASVFLLGIFMHVSRGIYYKSYMNFHTWSVGVLMLILSMLTAFFGYVLPWGQMSFWSATVITNLLSAIPFIGGDIVYWVWSGFSVGGATLTRFYTFHFLFPFILVVLSMLHLVFLHEGSSSNPLKSTNNSFKVWFWPYNGVKDMFSLLFILISLVFVVFFSPNLLTDPENYMSANPLVTPIHIKPEWYFLFAYAILRCIPNKGMSVLALVLSILVLFMLPVFEYTFNKTKIKVNHVLHQVFFWSWSVNFLILTWLGGAPVEEPFIKMAQFSSVIYFFVLMLICLS